MGIDDIGDHYSGYRFGDIIMTILSCITIFIGFLLVYIFVLSYIK